MGIRIAVSVDGKIIKCRVESVLFDTLVRRYGSYEAFAMAKEALRDAIAAGVKHKTMYVRDLLISERL